MRLLFKQDKIGKKIDGDWWNKPKWMREKTFKKLRSEYIDLDEKMHLADMFSLRDLSTLEGLYEKYPMACCATVEFEKKYGFSLQ